MGIPINEQIYQEKLLEYKELILSSVMIAENTEEVLRALRNGVRNMKKLKSASLITPKTEVAKNMNSIVAVKIIEALWEDLHSEQELEVTQPLTFEALSKIPYERIVGYMNMRPHHIKELGNKLRFVGLDFNKE